MKRLFIVTIAIMGVCSVYASEPIQVSLTPDLAIHNRLVPIRGLSLNIWGENPQNGLALGFVNGSTGNSSGVSLGLLINYADNYTGIQWAPINYTKGHFVGWQGGLVNATDGNMKGLQTGFVNYSGRLTGLQFGFVNYTETAVNGVQIGFVNIIPENEWFSDLPNGLAPGMVFVNWKF